MDVCTNEMRVLILAAGLGTRLAPITDDKPKALVPVNGIPILMKQIDNLHKIGINHITIISGYKADILEKMVHEKYPAIHIIKNVDYATTNNMYSAYLGRAAVENHKFLMMNADVFFDASVITTLMDFAAPDAIVTDIGRYMDECMGRFMGRYMEE